MTTYHLISTSAADDRAYRALADICGLAATVEHRIIGGHMVRLLLLAYPTGRATERSTADADIGIDIALAGSGHLHHALTTAGYEATSGNSYSKTVGTETLDIDLLVAPGEKSQLLGGRRFDSAPGLYLALHSKPLNVNVIAETTGGESISIHACIPDLEAALILKALAWKKRRSDKDLVDLHSLLEIRQEHRRTVTTWRMNDTDRVATGTRLAAASALHELIDLAGREQLSGIGPATLQSRFAALIKSHVAQPR